MSILEDKTIFLTGATGSFGNEFVRQALTLAPRAIVCFSRGELLQEAMARKFNDSRLRFVIGDVRDRERVQEAMRGSAIVIHAGALKMIPGGEVHGSEFVKTNILGSMNVIEAAVSNGVESLFALSTDKAGAEALNLYGKTKAVMESLVVQANLRGLHASCSRYGNVMNARGEVLSLFLRQRQKGMLTITHPEMTRFWLTLEDGVAFVLGCLERMRGGEIFVPKMPSVRIVDLAEAIAPGLPRTLIGIRPGEKIHETLISVHEARRTFATEDGYEILPEVLPWDPLPNKVPEGFSYTSANNPEWLSVEEIRARVDQLLTAGSVAGEATP